MVGSSPIEGGDVDHRVALLELPGFEFVAGTVSTDLHLDRARAEVRCGPAGWLFTHLITIHTPRLCKLIHVILKLAVTAHRVVPFVTIVVTAKTTESILQVRSSDHLHQAVPIPCDLQT